MSATILIIDDEEKLRSLLTRIIKLEGYTVLDAGTLAAGWKILETEQIDIVLSDVKLPDGNGVDFTKALKEKYPAVEVILLTAYGNITDGIMAIRNGAFDYIVKGDDNDKIIPLLSRAVEKLGLQQKVVSLEKQLNSRYGFDSISGNSPALLEAIAMAKKVAQTHAPVLLTGETGTGKEVFASAIHYSSAQSAHPFVALNCSALGRDIIESELFGHKAGAFTGAVKDKKGLIEEARGGTLFLDEIGEMPIELQPKLLRFLENGTYYRVGESTPRTADVRLVAATNRDLQKEIAEHSFRSDLYYRIAVFTIELPALRDRPTDIIPLAMRYLQVYSNKTNKAIQSIDKQSIEALENYSWPGNVRELKNVMERAVILEDSREITMGSLPLDLQTQMMASPTDGMGDIYDLASIEKIHIQKILKQTKGNKAETARLLKIGLATLYRKLEEYKLK